MKRWQQYVRLFWENFSRYLCNTLARSFLKYNRGHQDISYHVFEIFFFHPSVQILTMTPVVHTQPTDNEDLSTQKKRKTVWYRDTGVLAWSPWPGFGLPWPVLIPCVSLLNSQPLWVSASPSLKWEGWIMTISKFSSAWLCHSVILRRAGLWKSMIWI